MSSLKENSVLDNLPTFKMKLHNEIPSLKKSHSRNNILNRKTSFTTKPILDSTSQKQLTLETTLFPENQSLFNENVHLNRKPSSSTPLNNPTLQTYDSRSIISCSESIRSNRRKKKANVSSSFINPTDIFAQNLSDAVMDADDSDDLESYVYRDKPTPSYMIHPWQYNNDLDPNDRYSYYSSTGTETDGDHLNHQEKYLPSRRPVLRSTVSEIRPSSSFQSMKNIRPSLRYQSTHFMSTYHPSDEEFTPLIKRSRTPRRRRNLSNYDDKDNSLRKTCITFVYIISSVLLFFGFLWIFLVFYASPLSDVEVVGISNVLGTQKELIFNLQVKARNRNWWTIRMTNTAFSVFASSHYVPTAFISLNDTNQYTTTLGADPAEFLGTIYHLEDPLIYEPGGLFESVTSTATSQIQIKNPGATKDDHSGNERWSLLIRYPYELTVRGVLKYQILPYLPTLTQLHSVRVCKMSRIDPATGKISLDIPIPEKSICDDPSPVEGSSS